MPKTNLPSKAQLKSNAVASKIRTFSSAITSFIRRNARRLLMVVAVLFVLVVIATQFTKKPVEAPQVATPKPLKVETMTVNGQTAGIETTGSVKNLGSITLVAQTAGPVRSISGIEGKQIGRGAHIVSQETGYGTGNAAAINVQIAQKNSEMSQNNYKNTQDSVNKARQIADENRTNTEELRKISEQSINDTKVILSTAQQIIDKLQTDLKNTTNETTILGLRQQLVQYQGLLASNNASLRNLEYSTNTDKSPTKLAEYTKESIYISTQMQLDAARIGAEISALNVKSAQVMASLSTVRAPFAGSIERIYVTKGQYLTPGTPVAKITGKTELCLVIPVSGFTASQIPETGLIDVQIGNTSLQVPITHVPSTPTSGQLYEVLAVIPESYKEEVYEGQSVNVTLPTIAKRTDGNLNSHRVPLESVFVTNLDRYVFIYQDGKAVRRVVETGNVIGDQIEITSGLNDGEQLILDRRVIDGQSVEATTQEKEVQERG